MEVQSGAAIQTAVQSHAKVQRLFVGPKTDKFVINEYASYLILVATSALAIAAFPIVSGGVLLDIVGCFLVVYSPLCIVQRCQLKRLHTLRQFLNELRNHVNTLMTENRKLELNLSILQRKQEQLSGIEKDFGRLAAASGTDIETLVALTKEFEEVNKKLKEKAEAAIINQLITTVLRSDNDGDLHINGEELKELITRLENTPDLEFQKDNFVHLLGFKNFFGMTKDTNIPIEKVMNVIRDIKSGSIPPSESIILTKTINSVSASNKNVVTEEKIKAKGTKKLFKKK